MARFRSCDFVLLTTLLRDLEIDKLRKKALKFSYQASKEQAESCRLFFGLVLLSRQDVY